MLNARANSYIFSKKGPLRVIALITLWSFLFSVGGGEYLMENAWAARTPLELTGVGSNRSGSPASFKELNVETFTLPQYLGQIKNSFKGSSDKIVVHIQDAHCNYAAQHKINDIIAHLNKEYGIDTINLEGGKGDYDLSVFTRIHDKNIRRKVADYFVKEGLVNGAEYFAINNPDRANLWGIEDTELYLKNLHVYRESIKHKEEIEKYLKELDHIISNLKRHIYNAELLELDQKYTDYKTEKLKFKDYLTYLIQEAGQKAIDIKTLANIYLLHESLKQEDDIDFKMANIERNRLIDEFEKMLSKNSLKELVEKTVEFKTEQISQKDYYTYLAEKANQMNFDLTKYPELKKYIAYISTYEAIDKTEVMEELALLESSIKENTFENEDQKTLDTLSKNLILTKNIFGISMSREDYEYYKTHQKTFNIQNYENFISKKAPLYKIKAKLSRNIKDLDTYRNDITKFYDYSFKRDKAFLKNIKSSKTSLLITGGFHTENLCELFKKKGISYISIMPNFKNGNGYESPYFSLLGGDIAANEENIINQLELTFSSQAMAIAALTNVLGQKAWGNRNISQFHMRAGLQYLLKASNKRLENIENITSQEEGFIQIRFTDGSSIRASAAQLLHQMGEAIDSNLYDFNDIGETNAERSEALRLARELTNDDEILAAIARLVAGNPRSELGLKHDLHIQKAKGFQKGQLEHAGGYGVTVEDDLEGEPLKEAILHGIIAGFVQDHTQVDAITKALLNGDAELAKGLFYNAQKHTNALWDMTEEERKAAATHRDFANVSQNALMHFLSALQQNDDVTTFHRTLKLVASSINNDASILTQRGPMQEAQRKDTLNRLNEFSLDNTQTVIDSANRGADYNPIRAELAKLEVAQTPAQVAPVSARPTPTQPRAEAVSRVAGLNRDLLRDRVGKKEAARQKIENNQAPDVINFGDKHGEAADLERILRTAQQAAQDGRKLVIVGHGDAFDRGMQNFKNFKILQQLLQIAKENPNIQVNLCFGNHDAMLIQAVLLGDAQARDIWLGNGGTAFLEELGLTNPNDLIANQQVRELALWLLTNLKLFHVDERGFLHLHAGVPADANGNPLMTMRDLHVLQAELQEIQRQAKAGQVDRARIAQFFDKANPLIWAREEEWLNNLCENGELWRIEIDDNNKQKAITILDAIEPGLGRNWQKLLANKKVQDILRQNGVEFTIAAGVADKNKLDNFLAQLGINGIIFGHIHLDGLLNLDNRIFCVDVDEGDAGHLIFNGEGIRFKGMARSTEDLIATKGTLLANVDEEIIRLKNQLGEGTAREEAQLRTHTTQVVKEKVVTKDRIVKQQEHASFPKDRMRQFKLGLNINWANKLFEFGIRESTSISGAMRVWDIKIGGRNIAVVVIRNAQGRLVQGDSLLIKEGDALKIGRDRARAAYCFVVGGRTFDVAEYQGKYGLIERQTPINESELALSRTIVNTTSDLVVTIDEGATSQTVIEPMLMVSSREEAIEVLKEIAKTMEVGLMPTLAAPATTALPQTVSPTAQPTQPVEAGISAETLKQHLIDLQNQAQQSGNTATLHRTLKLIAASINDDPTILTQRGAMKKAQYDNTLGRLGDFSLGNMQRLIDSANRGVDYNPIRAELAHLQQVQAKAVADEGSLAPMGEGMDFAEVGVGEETKFRVIRMREWLVFIVSTPGYDEPIRIAVPRRPEGTEGYHELTMQVDKFDIQFFPEDMIYHTGISDSSRNKYYLWDGPVLIAHGGPGINGQLETGLGVPVEVVLRILKTMGINRVLLSVCNDGGGRISVPEGMEVIHAAEGITWHGESNQSGLKSFTYISSPRWSDNVEGLKEIDKDFNTFTPLELKEGKDFLDRFPVPGKDEILEERRQLLLEAGQMIRSWVLGRKWGSGLPEIMEAATGLQVGGFRGKHYVSGEYNHETEKWSNESRRLIITSDGWIINTYPESLNLEENSNLRKYISGGVFLAHMNEIRMDIPPDTSLSSTDSDHNRVVAAEQELRRTLLEDSWVEPERNPDGSFLSDEEEMRDADGYRRSKRLMLAEIVETSENKDIFVLGSLGLTDYLDMLHLKQAQAEAVNSAPTTQPITTQEILKSRQAQTVEALAAAEGRGVPIRTLVVVEGVGDKELKDLEERLNEGLYRNGFGTNQPGSRRGRSTHELLLVSGKKDHESEPAFEKRLKDEIDMARGYLPDEVKNKDRIVTVFAPLNISSSIRNYVSKKHGKTVSVINDAYSDSSVNMTDRSYPDAMLRYAIARQIFASTISKSLREGALETINNLLQKITEDGITIDIIEKLFSIDFILRIKPVDWNEEIGKWQVSQEATATAL